MARSGAETQRLLVARRGVTAPEQGPKPYGELGSILAVSHLRTMAQNMLWNPVVEGWSLGIWISRVFPLTAQVMSLS